MNPGKMTDAGYAKLRGFEALKLYVYDDHTGERLDSITDVCLGTATAGYGHTGTDVKPGMPLSKELAERWLEQDIELTARAIDRALTVPLTPTQRDALISLAFNCGLGRPKGTLGSSDEGRDGILVRKDGSESAVLRAINEARWADVPALWRQWNKSGGKVLRGLVNRRDAELGLWASGAYVASADIPVDAPSAASAPPVHKSAIKGLSLGAMVLAAMNFITINDMSTQIAALKGAVQASDLPPELLWWISSGLTVLMVLSLIGIWIKRNVLAEKHGV